MTSGNPVNPLLGAKVLPGETDLALPGPLPFILSRTYSSYRTKTPAPVGIFGPGWKAPSDIRLQIRDDALVLNDNGGRSIHFEPLLPGEAVYSRSESMWLVRGGKAAQPDGHTLARLWGALPPDIRLSPHLYLATNSAQGPWWILGWSELVPGAEDVLPAPLPPYRVLTGLADRFGRTLTYRREAAGDLAGEITGVTDGAGREFRLVLTTQAQRAEEARTSSLSSSDSSRPLSASPLAAQLEAEYIPERKLHLYHCDHRGLPLALISPEGETAWQGEYDEWGNLLGEESAQHLQQSLRLPGQQYDEESGLYYNRNRYYDPLQGRYITQDPIGLRGEWNLYKYPLNPVRFIDSLGLKFHVNGDPSDFNQAVEYLKQDSQMKETIDFLSSSEETINIEYIEGTNVRFNSNNMAIYWNSRASLFCSTELNSKSQSPALGLGHEFAHAQYYLLDKENFMALLSRTDKKYENKEEARVITIIESRAAKTLGECTRGAHSGLPFYRVDGPLQTMKITGTPE